VNVAAVKPESIEITYNFTSLKVKVNKMLSYRRETALQGAL